MRIAIIGGHGKIALLAAPQLVDAGHQVTSLIRDAAQSADIEATGAKPLVLSLEDAQESDLVEAFEDMDAVVFSAGAGGGNPERTIAVDRDGAFKAVRAAQRAGVDRFVMVSYFGAGRVNLVPSSDPFHTYQEAKHEADLFLAASELDWTILGPGTLTLDPSPHGVTPARPAATAGSPEASQSRATSRELVAEVIVAVIGDDRASRRTLDFTDGGTEITTWLDEVVAGDVPGAQA